MLKTGHLDTAEEKMIPRYLDAVDILVALRTGTKPTDELANRLEAIIRGVREIGDKAFAFIAGLYDALATVLLDVADRMCDRSGTRIPQALARQVKAMGHLQRSVKLDQVAHEAEIAW